MSYSKVHGLARGASGTLKQLSGKLQGRARPWLPPGISSAAASPKAAAPRASIYLHQHSPHGQPLEHAPYLRARPKDKATFQLPPIGAQGGSTSPVDILRAVAWISQNSARLGADAAVLLARALKGQAFELFLYGTRTEGKKASSSGWARGAQRGPRVASPFQGGRRPGYTRTHTASVGLQTARSFSSSYSFAANIVSNAPLALRAIGNDERLKRRWGEKTGANQAMVARREREAFGSKAGVSQYTRSEVLRELNSYLPKAVKTDAPLLNLVLYIPYLDYTTSPADSVISLADTDNPDVASRILGDEFRRHAHHISDEMALWEARTGSIHRRLLASGYYNHGENQYGYISDTMWQGRPCRVLLYQFHGWTRAGVERIRTNGLGGGEVDSWAVIYEGDVIIGLEASDASSSSSSSTGSPSEVDVCSNYESDEGSTYGSADEFSHVNDDSASLAGSDEGISPDAWADDFVFPRASVSPPGSDGDGDLASDDGSSWELNSVSSVALSGSSGVVLDDLSEVWDSDSDSGGSTSPVRDHWGGSLGAFEDWNIIDRA